MAIFLAAAVATLGVATAIGHSTLSERLFLRPLFAGPQDGFFAKAATRDITRAVFHIPSLTWGVLGLAVLLARLCGSSTLLSLSAAVIFAGSGIANIAALRRAHPGGLMLIAAAALTFMDWALHA